MTALSIMRLVPTPPGRIVAGTISLRGEELLKASDQRMRELRGNRISMIFQEPMTSLNPVFTIGDQIAEAVRLHKPISAQRLRQKPSRCCGSCEFPTQNSAFTIIHINSPAACGNA